MIPRTRHGQLTMEDAVSSPGIDWLGGMSRDEAATEVSRHDVGLSWRDRSMDSSLEISTKVLEYAALGVPPVVNRNAQHLELFGADYPLYVDDDSADGVVSASWSARRTPRRAEGGSQQPCPPLFDFSISSAAESLFRAFGGRLRPQPAGQAKNEGVDCRP